MKLDRITLELGDPAFTVQALRHALPFCDVDFDSEDRHISWMADQIEAQTKPPRIPEPGLWGVVKAQGGEYVNIGAGWISSSSGLVHTWGHLIDPVLVREGMQS